MGIGNVIKRIFGWMITAIIVLIVASLIPLSFTDANQESDEEIPSLSLPLLEDTTSNTYFNIEIEMNVLSISESLEKLTRLVQEKSGIMLSSSLSTITESSKSYIGSCTIELDAVVVEQFLSEVQSIGQITQMNTYTNSEVLVTEDVESWLSNLKMQQSKYQTLLSESTTVSETIKLEEELARIQTEIDKWSALKNKSERAETKVTLTFQLKENSQQVMSEWSFMIKDELSIQLNRISRGAKWLIVKLIGLTPYLLIIGFLAIAGRFFFRRRRRRR